MSEQILDIPKSKSIYESFKLPCGYIDEAGKVHADIDLREITGHEEDLLASEKIKSSVKSNRLLSACITRIGDYTDKKKIEEIVVELLAMDRYFILLKLRMISLGRIFKFEMACPNCNDKKIRQIDLEEVKFSPKEGNQKIFSGKLPKSGLDYKWHCLNGKLESRVEGMTNIAENLMTAMLFQRVIEIDNSPVTLAVIKSLQLMDRNFLRGEFDKHEGKVDDKIEIGCPNCGTEFSTHIDFSNREFFFPSLT